MTKLVIGRVGREKEGLFRGKERKDAPCSAMTVSAAWAALAARISARDAGTSARLRSAPHAARAAGGTPGPCAVSAFNSSATAPAAAAASFPCSPPALATFPSAQQHAVTVRASPPCASSTRQSAAAAAERDGPFAWATSGGVSSTAVEERGEHLRRDFLCILLTQVSCPSSCVKTRSRAITRTNPGGAVPSNGGVSLESSERLSERLQPRRGAGAPPGRRRAPAERHQQLAQGRRGLRGGGALPRRARALGRRSAARVARRAGPERLYRCLGGACADDGVERFLRGRCGEMQEGGGCEPGDSGGGAVCAEG